MYYSKPYISRFDHTNYQFHGQIWDALEAPYGEMMFAHNKGLLIYNGNSWDFITLPNNQTVKSIQVIDDKIFIGGYNEIGYLKISNKGEYQYQSIISNRNIGEVYEIFKQEDMIYFWGESLTSFCQKTNKTETITFKPFHTKLTINNKHYLMVEGSGLKYISQQLMEDKNTTPFYIPENDDFYSFACEFSAKTSLVYSNKNGFIIFNPQTKSWRKWYNELETHEDFEFPYEMYKSVKGDYIINLPSKGLYILNERGKLLNRIGENILNESIINNIYEDSNANLWVLTNSGIYCFEFNSPFRIFDTQNNINGQPIFTEILHDSLYVGSTSGISNIALKDLTKPVVKFNHKLKGHLFISHAKSKNEILCSDEWALYSFPSNKILYNRSCSYLHIPVYDSSIVYLSSGNHILRMRKEYDQWLYDNISGYQQQVSTITSVQKNRLWVKRFDNKIEHLIIDPLKDSIQEIIPLAEYIDSSFVYESHLSIVDKQLFLLTEKGVFVFDTIENRFNSLESFNKFLKNHQIHGLIKDPDEKYWFWSKDKTRVGGFYCEKYGGFIYDSISFKRFQTSVIFDINFIHNQAIISNTDNLCFYSPGYSRITHNIKVYFSDIKDITKDTLLVNNPLQNNILQLDLKPDQNNIQFNVFSDLYILPNSLMYSYYVENLDDKWSNWSHATYKEYTSLPPGNYTIQARVKDFRGHISTPIAFDFSIASPWYYSIYIKIIFLLTFIITIFALYKLARNLNLKDRQRIEKKILNRTNDLTREREALKKDLEAINELNIAKDKFFSIIAHDLRSPFNALLGLTEVLTEDYDDFEDDERKQMVQNINKTSHLNFNLLDNLLNWSRSQRGAVEMMLDYYNFSEIISDTVNLNHIALRSKKITLNNYSTENLKGYFDKNMVHTICRNILSNAIKFTESSGVIDISTTEDDKNIICTIKDNGIGISQTDLINLFDISKQTKRKGTQNETGTGLGLILCKEFAEKNNGSLTVSSEINNGSAFTITLPKHPPLKN